MSHFRALPPPPPPPPTVEDAMEDAAPTPYHRPESTFEGWNDMGGTLPQVMPRDPPPAAPAQQPRRNPRGQ